MNSFRLFALSTALVSGVSQTAALAEQVGHGTSDMVRSIQLELPSEAVITVRNMAAQKHVNSVQLETVGNSVDFTYSGGLKCKNKKKVLLSSVDVYYGPLSFAANKALNTALTKHSQTASVAVEENGIAESTPPDNFSVPLSKISSGSPVIALNPVAEIQKKFNAHVQGGGSAEEFYQNDQEVVVKRPLSLGGTCAKAGIYNDYSLKNHESGFDVEMASIRIRYEGDPEVTGKPLLNAQIPQGGGLPNAYDNTDPVDQPFKLETADFIAVQNYTGKCIPDSNPKINITFQASGDMKGIVDLYVVAESNTYNDTNMEYATIGGIANDPGKGPGSVSFYFPLREILQYEDLAYLGQPNKTISHNMRIKGRYRNQGLGETMSELQDFGTAVFKHRCIPQVNAVINQGNGIQGYDNSGTGETTKLKVLPIQKNSGVQLKKPSRADDSTPETPVLKVAPQSTGSTRTRSTN